jgi:hypothetical protein
MDKPFSSKVIPQFNTLNWEYFSFDDLFEIRKGQRLTKAQMVPGDIPFIGSIDNNNGVSGYGCEANHSVNTITVNYNGSVGEAFYQSEPYWACDDVNVLYPKFIVNQFIAMFIIAVIRNEQYRFNYGRKWHIERMLASRIKLPVDENQHPDWTYMERYIQSLKFSSQI